MAVNRISLAAVVLLIILTLTISISADEISNIKGRVSVLGALGASNATGDYPSEYDASPQFSFYPGLRVRMDEVIKPKTFFLIDFGYMETGFKGYVLPASSYFFNTYEYLNLNILLGAEINQLYYGAGVYIGFGLDSYSYYEYTDEWTYFDSNNDFGIAAEIGTALTPFVSIGIQARYGLKSIGTSVDIKNTAVLATVQIHFIEF